MELHLWQEEKEDETNNNNNNNKEEETNNNNNKNKEEETNLDGTNLFRCLMPLLSMARGLYPISYGLGPSAPGSGGPS